MGRALAYDKSYIIQFYTLDDEKLSGVRFVHGQIDIFHRIYNAYTQ